MTGSLVSILFPWCWPFGELAKSGSIFLQRRKPKPYGQGRQEKGIGPIFHRFRVASAETLVLAIEVRDQGKEARLGSDNFVSADQIEIKLDSFHLHNYSSG